VCGLVGPGNSERDRTNVICEPADTEASLRWPTIAGSTFDTRERVEAQIVFAPGLRDRILTCTSPPQPIERENLNLVSDDIVGGTNIGLRRRPCRRAQDVRAPGSDRRSAQHGDVPS
jgi:hypothetical protein